jgi:hypothetical protein
VREALRAKTILTGLPDFFQQVGIPQPFQASVTV